MSAMFANKEVASRHLPVAHGRDDKRDETADSVRARRSEHLARRISETRLQVAVAPERKRDDGDPYADVPCTD